MPHSHPLRGVSFQRISLSTPPGTERAEVGPAGLASPWEGSLGWATPFLMACPLSGLAVPLQLPNPSCSIRATLSPFLDSQDSRGINPMGIWLPGQRVLGTATSRGWGAWPLLGAEEQLCLFSICCEEQQGKFFLLFILFFRGFVCSSPARIRHVNILLCLQEGGGVRPPTLQGCPSCPPPASIGGTGGCQHPPSSAWSL